MAAALEQYVTTVQTLSSQGSFPVIEKFSIILTRKTCNENKHIFQFPLLATGSSVVSVVAKLL